MPQQVQGVISRAKDAPVELVTINVPDPGPGEAVVQVQACGVCHTDLHYVQGGIGDDYPYLLGHEAAGIVEAVGDGVADLAPGDYVILNWRAVCGRCRACRRGRPWYCFDTANATQAMTLEDGTRLNPALGIGAFAQKTLVAAGQCTKVDPKASPATAGLLGCGVMAGLGAAVNTGAVGRGGGSPVLRALSALPPGTVDARVKITEQGEVISQKFGLPEIADRSLEVLLTGVALASRSDWRMSASASFVASLIDCVSAAQTWRFMTAIDDGEEFAARSLA